VNWGFFVIKCFSNNSDIYICMKVCIKCENEKSFDEYHSDRSRSDGYSNICKLCKNEKSKSYRLLTSNIDKVKAKEYGKKWREKNKIKTKEYNKKWRKLNPDKVKEFYKNLKISNPDKVKNTYKKSYYKNRGKYKERRRKYNREYVKKRKLDPIYKFNANIRSMISNLITERGYFKISKTQDILGCTFKEFKIYLESKFEPWMNWDNYGLYNGELNYGWDIDHIIPSSSALTLNEVVKLNHFTNLQPLCSKINRVFKSNH